MSNRTYNDIWRDLSSEIAEQQEYESPKDPALVPKDRESALIHLSVLYAKYVRMFQKLETTHDQVVHPQKRRLLRDMLMALTGRLLELKMQMYELDATDFPNMEAVYHDLKLVPEDLVVSIPKCFVEERAKVLKEREQMLDTKGARPLDMENKIAFPELTLEEAILILQRNERGRQGRIRAKYMRDIRLQEDQDADMDGMHDESQIASAVQKIQRMWRGFVGRKRASLERRKESEFLGLSLLPSHKERSIAQFNIKRRKDIQVQHEEEYQQALISIKEKIRKVEGPDMKESYQDAFRQWYMDSKREQGKFPDFPPDEEWKLPDFKFGQKPPELAGAAADANAATAGSDAKGSKSGSAGKKKPDAAAAKGGAKKGGKDAGKGGGAGEAEEPVLINATSKYLQRLQGKQGEYIKEWKEKNEQENFAQRHDVEIIKSAKRAEVDAEIKDELFAALRDELENLKLAMEKDGKKKKKDGGKKKKKDKKAGGKKGKKEKDLTGGRPLEELIDELIAAGLMQKPTPARMRDLKCAPTLLYKEKLNAEPASLDVLRAITEYAVLPLGMDNVDDEVTPVPPRSILLYGPTGCGKSMLCNIVANEVGAAVFNLSPKTTAGQYVGKSNVARMVYTVFKVAKLLAPAIVIVDDAEAVFCKKVPKEDTSDPKRVRKDLVKAINGLKPSDRVLVIGMSRNPFYSDAKAMSDAFHRQIYISRPNYALREVMWREWMLERVFSESPAVQAAIAAAAASGQAAVPPASGATGATASNPSTTNAASGSAGGEKDPRLKLFHALQTANTSVLARLSAGMSGAMIQALIKRTLTPRRIRQLDQRSLQTMEVVHHMLQLAEPDRKVEQDFKDWTLKLPVFKKREIVLGLVQVEEEGDGKGKGKDAGKKKK
ncbi:hypothetical protein BCR44DRAFT_74550 [Catenaria anguillulae PL171]|uniref:AAA+ ATPase domain-containing protein n=1 Tax=Catenaria anguillulae PL171 TaxID=765915 RepID=A0A1Y2HY12_9FUNG|nr:hypothetical protein BCR44DRAFT_74550 [Catenaria anguillulae PL171]